MCVYPFLPVFPRSTWRWTGTATTVASHARSKWPLSALMRPIQHAKQMVSTRLTNNDACPSLIRLVSRFGQQLRRNNSIPTSALSVCGLTLTPGQAFRWRLFFVWIEISRLLIVAETQFWVLMTFNFTTVAPIAMSTHSSVQRGSRYKSCASAIYFEPVQRVALNSSITLFRKRINVQSRQRKQRPQRQQLRHTQHHHRQCSIIPRQLHGRILLGLKEWGLR